jgi:hypothetical protein
MRATISSDQHAHDPLARGDGRPFRMRGALDVGAEPQQRLPLNLRSRHSKARR